MIFGNVRNLHEYPFLEQAVQACFEYAKTHDLRAMEKGSHPIQGDDLFVNLVEYTTTDADKRFWEAHRQYLDLHFMLQGEEQIDLNFIENLEQGEFVPKDDFLPLQGEEKQPGRFAGRGFPPLLPARCPPDRGCRPAAVCHP